jgi:hypothetical protein
MPVATDLVTDLPADFEVFGQAVATSMADLLGGTSGQILAKNSNTDMDFVWIANDQGDITGITAGNGISVTNPTGPTPTVAINTAVTADLTTAQTLTNKTLTSPALTTPTISTLTTDGDLLYGTGSGVLARRGIGATGNVLTVSGGLPVWAAPTGGGKVLQVVQGSTTTETGIASTSYSDTTLTASITPSSATSKILVIVAQASGLQKSSGIANGCQVKLLRGATTLMTNTKVIWLSVGGASSVENYVNTSIVYLDSPSSTSALTYKTQGAAFSASSGQALFQPGDDRSSITLLEIGA